MLFFEANSTTVMNYLETFINEEVDQLFSRNLFPNLAVIVGTFALIIFLYWLFNIPCNWTKHLNDVSYDIALTSAQKINSNHKKDAINRLRRSRAIGVKELPPPFPNGWYCLLESSCLKLGEVKHVSCLGENFVIFRTMANKVHVLNAYCPHMGANMGIGGRVIGDNIECPFHHWSFRGRDGKCANVPYSSCIPQTSSVRKWISHEVNDNIFVWYHAEFNETPWKIPVVQEIEQCDFIFHGRNEFYVNCHVQEIPENGADLAHFAAIHNDSFLAGGNNPKESILAKAGNHLWQAVWNTLENPKHIACVTLKHSVELTTKFNFMEIDVKAEQIGPSYVQLHMKSQTFGRFEVLQTVTPIEPLLQKVVHRFYGPRILAPIMKLVIMGESIMFERDMAMWNHKTYRNKPHLVKEDASIKSFRNWYSQFYTENSKSFAEAYDKLVW